MRLWHKILIPVLPNKQLVSQWRECCAIAGEIAKHGSPRSPLTRKIMDYPIDHFWNYTNLVIYEMIERGYKIQIEAFLKNYRKIGPARPEVDIEIFPNWHNDRYLSQCYYNLQEKYDCGMIPEDEWEKVENWPRYI